MGDFPAVFVLSVDAPSRPIGYLSPPACKFCAYCCSSIDFTRFIPTCPGVTCPNASAPMGTGEGPPRCETA